MQGASGDREGGDAGKGKREGCRDGEEGRSGREGVVVGGSLKWYTSQWN